MGLASKLAASAQQTQPQVAQNQAARPPLPLPGQASPAQQQQNQYAPGPPAYVDPSAQYGQTGQSKVAPQTSNPAYGAPPQQHAYGAPPPQQQQQYGAPPPQQQQAYGQPQQQVYGQAPPQGQAPPVSATGAQMFSQQAILAHLIRIVQDQKIMAFYPPGSLERLAQTVAGSGALEKVAGEWKLPNEIAIDLVSLCLFDTIIYADDSGSMSFEEGGTRIDDLKLIVGRVAFAASLFDQDGIQVRFMNSRIEGNGIRSERDALNLVNQVKFSGLTPIGTQLDQKVLQPLVLGPARAGRLEKPVLVIIITDGIPGGEDRQTLSRVIGNAANELARTRYGSDSISFQLAQVGNDQKARAFLEEIDNNPQIGGLVDTTSNYENEQEDMSRANPPVDLTPELWLVKMMLGGIDSSYDAQDE